MTFLTYIKSKIIPICFILIAGICISVFLYSFRVDSTFIVFTLSGIFIFYVFYLFTSWILVNKRLNCLNEKIKSINEKYLCGEIIQPPANEVEYVYYQIMKEISRSAIGEIENLKSEQSEYLDYIESFVHEIKTPLTACSLILSNDMDAEKLKAELKRADNLTDTIINYASLRTINNDTQIQDANLLVIINKAIKSEMELLIASKISVSVNADSKVKTDPKLLEFILKQLLINCAKYCHGCKITIESSSNTLSFTDNGPGIKSYEINRIFDRGFTGSVARNTGKSTGMGLYIVKKFCEQLNINIEAISNEGEFTTFIFTFPN